MQTALVDPLDYKLHKKFNMFFDHYNFNETDIAELMHDDTLYFACIRHPLLQAKSLFTEHHIDRKQNISHTDNPFKTYTSSTE